MLNDNKSVHLVVVPGIYKVMNFLKCIITIFCPQFRLQLTFTVQINNYTLHTHSQSCMLYVSIVRYIQIVMTNCTQTQDINRSNKFFSRPRYRIWVHFVADHACMLTIRPRRPFVCILDMVLLDVDIIQYKKIVSEC